MVNRSASRHLACVLIHSDCKPPDAVAGGEGWGGGLGRFRKASTHHLHSLYTATLSIYLSIFIVLI